MTNEKIKRDPPVKICDACFRIDYVAVKICKDCGNPFPKRIVAPKWRTISENEGAIQVEGRNQNNTR